MSATINRDEWLKALDAAGLEGGAEDDRDAVTVNEFAAMFGLTRGTAERRLQGLAKARKATRTRKVLILEDRGRRVACIAYRLCSKQMNRAKGLHMTCVGCRVFFCDPWRCWWCRIKAWLR